MESSSTRSRDDPLDDDEDMAFFLTTIKLHDRFATEYYNEDENFSSDEESADDGDFAPGHQKNYISKPPEHDRHHLKTLSEERTVLSCSEAEAISMLDTARRSSCQRSGRRGFTLGGALSSKVADGSGSDDLDLDDDALLGRSFGGRPPFGDPLSEDDILSSALNLLDDEKCKKYCEIGLFDGFAGRGRGKGSVSTEPEKLMDDLVDARFAEPKFSLMPFQRRASESSQSQTPLDEAVASAKPSFLDGVQEIEDRLPTPPPELSEDVQPNHRVNHRQQSICTGGTKCCKSDGDSSVVDCPVGDGDSSVVDCPVGDGDGDSSVIGCPVGDGDSSVVDSSVVDCPVGDGDSFGVRVVKSANQESKKKIRSTKRNFTSVPATNAKTTKSKKMPAKKTESSSKYKTAEINRSTEERIVDDDVDGTQNADRRNGSDVVTSMKDLPPTYDLDRDVVTLTVPPSDLDRDVVTLTVPPSDLGRDGVTLTVPPSDLGRDVVTLTVPPSDVAHAEDGEEGLDESFTVVCGKRRSPRMRRMDASSHASVALGREEIYGVQSGSSSRGSASNASAYGASCSAASTLNATSRLTSRSSRSNDNALSRNSDNALSRNNNALSRNNDDALSKHSSWSSLSETSNFISSTSGRSRCRENRKQPCDDDSSPAKSLTRFSYASVLSQNLPAPSVSSETETETEGGGLLSPPQSEADTGFSSSASSLSPEETHSNGSSSGSSPAETKTEVASPEPSILSVAASEKASRDRRPALHESVVRPPESGLDVSSSSSEDPMPSIGVSVIPETPPECRRTPESSLRGGGWSDARSGQRPVKPRRSSDAVLFDTRKHRVSRSTAAAALPRSEFSFGFDSGDECTDPPGAWRGFTADDVKDMTFFAGSTTSGGTVSPDDGRSDVLNTDALPGCAENLKIPDQSPTNKHPDDVRATAHANPAIEGESDDGGCGGLDAGHASSHSRVTASEGSQQQRRKKEKDGPVEAPGLRSGRSDDTKTANVASSSCKRFDLRAAQKFLAKAFESVRRQEIGYPGRVIRL